jgi:hypothetical protein
MKSPTQLQTEQQPARGHGPVDRSDVMADEMAKDDDEFGDEPTVSNLSNLRNPAAQPVSRDSENDPARTPTGAYRLVRPATSDRLDLADPSPSVPAKTAKKRTIIGVTHRR